MASRKKNKPKYTPGPYVYEFFRDGVDDVWAIRSKRGKDMWVASINFWDEGDGIKAAKHEHDARLLTAAPELLDALNAMLHVTSQVPVKYRDQAFCDAVLDGRRIIEKAIGTD